MASSSTGFRGPSTPFRGFGSPLAQSQPQQSSPFGQQNQQHQCQQHQHSSYQQPYGSSLSAATQQDMSHPSFSSPQAGLPRSSSFRNGRRGPSGGSPSAGFGFSVYDTVAGAAPATSTPKTVRWDDAPQVPLQQSSAGSVSGPHHRSSPTAHYQQQYGNMYPTQQQQQHPYQLQQLTSYQPSFPSQQQHYNPYDLTAGIQTPQRSQQASMAGGRTGVNDAPSAQQQKSSTALTQSLSSQNASLWQTPTPQTPPQTKSAFSSSMARLTQPITMSSAPARAVAPSQVTKPAAQMSTTPAAGLQTTAVARDAVITTRSAIVTRVKWNVVALIVNWLVPRFGPVRAAYWLLLNAAFNVFGGETDVQLASVLSWLRSAFFILTIANLAEAVIRLQTFEAGQQQLSSEPASQAGLSTKRKPSLAHPPSRVVSSSSPSSSPSSGASMAQRSTPRHYAQNSPLRESIFRASASAQLGNGDGSSSPLGGVWRAPSQTPRFESARKSSATSTSPAAAFMARTQERMASGGRALGDASFDADATDLSSDSIEVNRALRALSASYERELSHSRSSTPTVVREGVTA